MKRPVKRFGMEYESDAAPYAYVEARWNQQEQSWVRVLATRPYDVVATTTALEGLSASFKTALSMIGASGISLHVAPFREAPTYWIDMSTCHPTMLGARPCGAEVIRYDVLGIQASAWTTTLDSRIRPIMEEAYSALAATFAPWRPT